MTPVETGVREYCANTREKGTVAVMRRRVQEQQCGIGLRFRITLTNPSAVATKFIKECDVEQRLNTENINLPTQSSKELISCSYCTIFDQKF